MNEKIKIDIISDVVCPWCIIGYKNLEKAISELGLEHDVEITWQPFELNPAMPKEGEHLRDHIARKYGSSPEESEQTRVTISNRGAELGFTFNFFDDMHIVNTRDAHILLEYARTQGKQTDLKLRLFAAYFSEQKDISDPGILLKEVESVGIDMKQALAIINDSMSLDQVRKQESYWQELGVSSVPTVVFNREAALSGAQPIGTFKKILTELVDNNGKFPKNSAVL